MRRTPPCHGPWFPGLLAGVVLFCSCGRDAQRDASGGSTAARYERLELTPIADPVEREPRIFARFDLGGPTEPAGLEVAARSTRKVELSASDGTPAIPALELRGDGEVSVTFRRPYPAGSFNRALVSVQVARREEIELRFWRDGERVHHFESQIFVGEGELRTLAFDLGELLMGEAKPLDAVSVHCLRARSPVALASVTLLFEPAAGWLPDPAGPAELVAIGNERRRAVGLVAGQPLEARLPAEAGTSLGFSYGTPAEILGPEPAELHVTLLDETGAVVLERDLSLDRRGAQPSWREAQIDLAQPGRELRARFELRSDVDAACALGEPALVRRRDDAPTVLLVTSDTHRADHVGAAHAGVTIRTPTIDALAARGVLFEDCVASINLTLPSHAALLTGVHPRDTGVVGNVDRLADQALTLAERFRAAGYATFGSVSAEHLVHGGVGQGFDRFSGPEGFRRGAPRTIARLVPWLAEARGIPLFVWVHVFDAHDPYEPPEAYRHLYYPADKDPYDRSLPEVEEALRAKWDPEARDLDWVEAQYRSGVTYLDEVLGELFGHERFANAVVALTADHGETLQGRRHFDHLSLYPSTMAVPLILSWPGCPAGTRVRTPVQQIDLGRTLLDLTGLADVEFPGHDLLAEAESGPRFGMGGNLKSAAIWWDGWFLTLALKRHIADEAGPPTEEHAVSLFFVPDDPECLHDRAPDEPERTRRMRAALIDWLVKPRMDGWNETPLTQTGSMVDELAQLGYATAPDDTGDGAWFDPECTCERCKAFD